MGEINELRGKGKGLLRWGCQFHVYPVDTRKDDGIEVRKR